jgi:soluble lytic murein transglycosylase-like protein
LLNPDAESPVGAKGLAQFMPATWADICKRLNYGAISPHVAKYAIDGGAYYMSKLYYGWSNKRADIDRWDLARASYNAGFGNLLKAQKKVNGAMSYAEIIKGLPAVTGKYSQETIVYVNRIHKWYRMLKCGLR